MTRSVSLLVGLALLAACEKQKYLHWNYECDAAAQQTIFLACVEKSRAPERLTAAGNDMDEVVEECSDAAHKIACKVVWEKEPR